MQYEFSAFNYNVDQKTLTHQGRIIEIPKKCHELLLYLLQNPKQLISRDALIDHVWLGRVVTHNTIDQSILKLRKALNEAHEGEYIEAVYGQGIRFLPAITVTQNPSTDKNPQPSADSVRRSWLKKVVIGIFLLIFVTVLIFGFFWNDLKSNFKNPFDDPLDDIEATHSELLNGPSGESNQINKDLWLIKGGRQYLQHLISLNPNLTVSSNTLTDSTAQNPTLLALSIESPETAMKTLLVKIKQNTQILKPTYTAELQIKQNNETTQQTTLNANRLTMLFPQIAEWTGGGYDLALSDAKTAIYSQDELALQNYLRAMFHENSGNSEKAISLLETAVEQDPHFKMAWYEMAIALRKQSDPRKALAILSALNTDEPNLAFSISLVTAQCLDALGEYQAAENTYKKTLQLAQNLKHPSKVAAVHISQGILFRKTKQFDQAQKVLNLAAAAVNLNSQPQLYGTIMNTHAKLAREMNQPLIAIDKAQLAIKAFQQSGDKRYQMQAKTVLASVLRLRNEFTQAEQLVKESLFFAEQLNNQRGISDNRTKLARIYQQTGRFRLAQEQWQQVITINAQLSLHGNTADAYQSLVKLNLSMNEVEQAKIYVKLLTQLYNEQPTETIQSLLTETELILALHNQELLQSERLVNELIELEHSMVSLYQGDLAVLKKNNTAAESHYLTALDAVNTETRFDLTVLLLNRLNDLYLTNNITQLNDNLLQTARYKPFIYPLQKYQALAAKVSGNYIKALSLMEELKLKAGDFWRHDDEMLLENMRSTQNQ